MYEFLKICHIVLAMGWVTGVFVAPRGIIYAKKEVRVGQPQGPAYELTVRTYRFSAVLGTIAIGLGLMLGYWLGWPTWTGFKMAFAAVLCGHYLLTGILLHRLRKGLEVPSDILLRIWNEASVLLVVGIVAVVVVRP